MELLNFIFRLGVVFAIFGFIWGLINLGIRLLTIGRQRQTTEIYLLKALQYLLLVDVTFLVCYNQDIKGLDVTSQLVFGSVVLLLYFVGKLQSRQNRQMLIKIYGNGMMQNDVGFNLRAEIGVIALSLAVFVMFWFKPEFAENAISVWFRDSILNIEDTPIFGFIFKVIGFFFLINILMKVVNSIMMLLSGRAFERPEKNNPKDDNHFDDFEEIK